MDDLSQEQLPALPPASEGDDASDSKWELKTLTERHKNICALIAQGLKRGQIAAICDVTPEYVTMLAKQPKCIAYIREMNAFAALQLDAMFTKTVEVINDAMDSGNTDEKLKAARLQLEVTKRLGRPDPNAGTDRPSTEDRLLGLAERLAVLASRQRQPNEITDVEFTEIPRQD